MPKKYKLTRDVMPKECDWLERTYQKDEIVFEYNGYTYGCISDNGEAFTKFPDETPFFELPRDSVVAVSN